ncbi:hypothetical protein KCP69_26200 [Salmonella enterica subsp. enterica]|nr:hypothetical protein KCP69_26200 [Salmonella enterica subsp. enterica]
MAIRTTTLNNWRWVPSKRACIRTSSTTIQVVKVRRFVQNANGLPQLHSACGRTKRRAGSTGVTTTGVISA